MTTILKVYMKSNSVFNKPSTFENRGDGTYFYNYNIIESTKQETEGSQLIQSFDYDQIIINGEPTYSKIVSGIVRSNYSSSKEIALINNYNRYLLDNTLSKYHDEYSEYLTYVSNVKQFVKQDCLDNAVLIDD